MSAAPSPLKSPVYQWSPTTARPRACPALPGRETRAVGQKYLGAGKARIVAHDVVATVAVVVADVPTVPGDRDAGRGPAADVHEPRAVREEHVGSGEARAVAEDVVLAVAVEVADVPALARD